MFIQVDGATRDEVEGYSYVNEKGNVEKVVLKGRYVAFEGSAGSMDAVYYSDIPKFIKALQAAYDHYNGLNT